MTGQRFNVSWQDFALILLLFLAIWGLMENRSSDTIERDQKLLDIRVRKLETIHEAEQILRDRENG